MTNKFGWRPDFPDFRDYTVEDVCESSPMFTTALKTNNVSKKAIDLREWCCEIKDQGEIGSCTAHAGVAAIEYYEKRINNKDVDLSRLFLYKVTRNLMGEKGDTGAYIRSMLGALVAFGTPPEKMYPYNPTEYDIEPSAFHYSLASNYKAVKYYKLDINKRGVALVNEIKLQIAAGFPVVFGFSVYSSIDYIKDGKITFPEKSERFSGGHAVLAVGYDDNILVGKSRGALIIQNSWGTSWGDKGFGYLPYDYVLHGLAVDFWSITQSDWLDLDQFI